MANTSTAELLARCLAGDSWTDELLKASLEEDSGRAFFRVIVERLGDSFEPRYCDLYVRLFARVLKIVQPGSDESAIIERYERIRQIRVCDGDPKRVYVLSRVTLGADVAVTSIILDGAKQRFPEAEIFFVGPRKNWELYSADRRLQHREFSYPRSGSIEERLRTAPGFEDSESLVIDPDSRFTQLGLLPVCPEPQYFFFESRAYAAENPKATLVELTRDWMARVFGVNRTAAFIAPERTSVTADIAVSFGVGDNPEKRVADPFEEQLLKDLVRSGGRVVLDEGAGGEESERVRRLCRTVPGAYSWSGAYAPFADAISRAKLFIGYDSAGQHVAAACGTPLLSIFAGFTSERMFHRWRPDGPGSIHVVRVDDRAAVDEVLARARQYLTL